MRRRRFLAGLGLLPFAPRIVEGFVDPPRRHISGTIMLRNEGAQIWWSLNGGPWEPLGPPVPFSREGKNYTRLPLTYSAASETTAYALY